MSGGIRRRKAGVGLALIATGAVGLVINAPPASADVDTAQGLAFGASVGGALTLLPPTPAVTIDATEATPPSSLGPIEQTAVDIDLPGILRAPVLRAGTEAGNLAGEDHGGFVESFAEVTNVTVGLNAITADAVNSSCSSTGDGSVGNVTVANLNIGSQGVLNGPIAPNTIIEIPGVLTVVLNEQISVDQSGSTSIIVRGAHIQLLPSPLFPTTTLDIIIAESRCAVQGPDVLTSTSTTTTTTTGATTTTTTGATTTTTTDQGSTTTTVGQGATTTMAPRTTTTMATLGTTTTTGGGGGPAAGDCHPSYVGVCLPVETAQDVDCPGGTGNGPLFAPLTNFRVVGDDVYDLDRDNDGIACEADDAETTTATGGPQQVGPLARTGGAEKQEVLVGLALVCFGAAVVVGAMSRRRRSLP